MKIRALVISTVCLLLTMPPAFAQTTYVNPVDVCSSIESINNNNTRLNDYLDCIDDNEGTLLYMGSCGGLAANKANEFEALDYCQLVVANVPITQVNNTGSSASNSPLQNSVLINVFGVLGIMSMARVGRF